MKKILALLVVMMFVPTLSFAMMVEKGTVELGGGSNLNWNSEETEFEKVDNSKTETDNFNLNLFGAYYVINNLGVGATFGYNKEDVKDGVESTFTFIGPALKYQFPLSEQLNLYVVGAGGWSKQEAKGDAADFDADGYFFQGDLGLSYFLSSSVALNGAIDYLYQNIDPGADLGDFTRTQWGLKFGISVYLR